MVTDAHRAQATPSQEGGRPAVAVQKNAVRPQLAKSAEPEPESYQNLSVDASSIKSAEPVAVRVKALEELLRLAENQKSYFNKKQHEFPAIEDFTDEDGVLSLPEDISPLLQQAHANGRYSEADWWLSTIQRIRSALAEPAATLVDTISDEVWNHDARADNVNVADTDPLEDFLNGGPFTPPVEADSPVPTHECEFRIGQAVHLAHPYAEDDPTTIYYVAGIVWEHRLVASRGWNISIATAEEIARGYGQTDGFRPSDLRAALAKEGR